MNVYHQLLDRQIKKHLKGISDKEALSSFLEAVNQSYQHYDRDKSLIQHALSLSSRELGSAYQQIRKEVKTQEKVLQKIKESISALRESQILPEIDELGEDVELLSFAKYLKEVIIRQRKTEASYHQSKERYRLIFESAFDGILLVDLYSMRFLSFNSKIISYFGYSEDDFLKLTLLDLMPEYQPNKCLSCEKVANCMETIEDEGTANLECVFKRLDGSVFFTETTLVYLPEPEQKIVAIIIKDITERKEAETRKEELLMKLEEVNSELRDFAHIVSHDLKAPLRGIASISQWLSADYADVLDEKGLEMLDLLNGRVHRMHSLIEGILAYSRVTRDQEDLVEFGLNEMLQEIIGTISPPENIEIRIENSMPVVHCEKTRLEQLFQNLISNAIKFMDKPEGRIRIGCNRRGGTWEYYVTDNGPGIEEAYFKKIFQMFQTLNNRDEFESTGIGLSIVKKVVELYGGDIRVESRLGEGTSFRFTLPKIHHKTLLLRISD